MTDIGTKYYSFLERTIGCARTTKNICLQPQYCGGHHKSVDKMVSIH